MLAWSRGCFSIAIASSKPVPYTPCQMELLQLKRSFPTAGMNETGATLSATSTKGNRSGKSEPFTSAVHSTWTYTDKSVAVCHITQTCNLWWHRNRHSTSHGRQPLGTKTSALWGRARSQLHLCRRGFPLSKSPKWVESEYKTVIPQTTKLFILELVERERERTRAKLACEAESRSRGTQPLSTKPEHPGWQFLSFHSDANQSTNYHREEERES